MTPVDRLPIFANPDIANIVLKSLRFIQEEKKVKLYIKRPNRSQAELGNEVKQLIRESTDLLKILSTMLQKSL